MRAFGAVLFTILLVAGNLFAQMDRPVTLSSSDRRVVRSEIRSITPGDPGTLVTTPVNRVGEHIPGLEKSDFKILKGKKQADILTVEEIKAVESTVMRVVFMVDNSQSMSPYLDVLKSTLEKVINGFSKAVRVAVLFFNEHLGDDTEFRYNAKPLPIVRLTYTDDKERAATYAKKMLVELNLSRKTYLYDGVYASFEQIKADTGTVDRSFAIIFSDGEDNASIVDPEVNLDAEARGTTFFTIDYRTKTNEFLKKLASNSGGEHYIAKNSDELVSVFENIANKIVAKGYRITYRFKAPPTAGLALGTPDLVMKEEIVRETFPLLNYVFFEKGSASIPERYTRLTSGQVHAFDESKIEGGALDYYYSILNIIGSRMRDMPEATITITGCTDNYQEERNNRALAMDRAQAVKSYLVTLWGIPEQRLGVEAITLPAVPSSSRDEDGRAENRRIEITSSDWNVLKPVTFVNRIASVDPEFAVIETSVEAPEGMESYLLTIAQNGSEFDRRTGQAPEKMIRWNWKNTRGRYPAATGDLVFTMTVTDKAGDSFATPAQAVAVREERSERRQNIEVEGGITRERISLILFEFDKAELGPRNERIMTEYVYPRFTKVNSISVDGYTDIIGKEEYNLRLSERRAKVAYDQLVPIVAGRIDAEAMTFRGHGETEPIFENAMPEGRFYNRTVGITLQR